MKEGELIKPFFSAKVEMISGKQCKDDPEFSCPDFATCCPLPKGEGDLQHASLP